MSRQADDTGVHDAPAHCENCGAALHGEFCHACGQSIHSPVRRLGHAIEEFFEAFWHLDGRVFRTLRDLMVPGRVASSYLAGHRARYIAPMRLFVILAVLTFFIGAAAIHVDENPVHVAGVDEINAATSVEEVERIRDGLVAGIEQARVEAGDVPGVDPALLAAEIRIQGAAANRLVELGAAPAADGAAAGAGAAGGADKPPGTDAAPRLSTPRRLQLNILGHRGEWHPRDNPFVVGWWPRFANDWLNRKLGNVERNLQSLDGSSADTWLQAMMSSAPSALFLLVPVFAVLLKVAYLFTRRLYLEHLVVALYSHAFLLVMLALAFVLSALGTWVESTALGLLAGLCFAAVLLWMPVYLLLMQKRVYGQAWWLTIVKYLVIGNIYFMLLLAATMLMFLARLAS